MRLSKKGWMVLSTLAIIGLGFAFYFLVYVKQREAEIIAEKMRVLTQVKANIGVLIRNESEIAKNQSYKEKMPSSLSPADFVWLPDSVEILPSQNGKYQLCWFSKTDFLSIFNPTHITILSSFL